MMAWVTSYPIVQTITRVLLGIMLLGRSYMSLAAPTGAPTEYIETPTASIQQLHEYLTDAAIHLAGHAKHVYMAFKNQRFGPEAEINPREDFGIKGLPDVMNLELPAARLIHTEEDLLETHRANLGVYYSAMQFLIVDESQFIGGDDFLHRPDGESTFFHIKDHISATSQKIEELMERKGFRGENQTPVQGTLTFRTEVQEHFRHVRDLCVLYEIYRYTNDVLLVDVRMQQTAHSNRDSITSDR